MVYEFDNFSLDVDRRELRRQGRMVDLEPQVFDLLVCLVRHRDRVVSRDEILAEVWNGRIVSESTLSSRISSLRRMIGDSGKDQRLIRTFIRKGLRFSGDVREHHGWRFASGLDAPATPGAEHALGETQKALMPPPVERAAIAVLPLVDLTPGASRCQLIGSIIEDVSVALSRFRRLWVIPCGPAFCRQGLSVDVERISRDLGAGYVLAGSAREAAGRLRITVRLLDATSGGLLWGHRFDEVVKGALDLQDHIAAGIVGAISPRLEQAEIERATHRAEENLGPYQCYLRGLGSVYRWTRQGMDHALSLFGRAIELDPEFGAAYGMAAYCYVQRKSYGWIVDRERESAECLRLARLAAETGGDDAVACTRAAHAIASVVGDIDSGAVCVERALQLNPHLAAAWYVSGWIRLFLGDVDVAADHLGRAIHLSPLDPLSFKTQAAIAYAHLLAGRYDEAAHESEMALLACPHYQTGLRGAAASHALAGRRDRARTLITEMRRFDPALNISNLSGLIPFRRAQDFERWAQGLSMAGLPEG